MIAGALAVTSAATGTVLSIVYLARHRGHPTDRYVPAAAWLRAAIVCCGFYVIAWSTGVLDEVFDSPVATPSQTADPAWWAFLGAVAVLAVLAYWVVWSRYTIRFDRSLHPIPQVAFGVMWGSAFSMYFLSLWHLVERTGPGLATWQVYLITYAAIGVWQGLFMSHFWDVWVSPEHDSPVSIRLKVPTIHVPTILTALGFFALHRNHALFVALLTLGFIGASVGMRIPPFWSKQTAPAPEREPSILFGLPRATGYRPEHPESDPYLKAAHMRG